MKSASTNDRTEYILYDAVGGSRSKPIAKLDYSQDQGSSFTEFEDIENISYSASNNNKQYSKFIQVPPAHTMNATFNNKGQKYSPGAGGTFSNILTRNLLVRPSFGYQMLDTTETSTSFTVTNYNTLYHTKIVGSTIKNDITSAGSFTALPSITEGWYFYDGLLYDSGTYSPEGYYLSNVVDFKDTFGSLELTKLIMTSDSDNIHVYYRSSDIQNVLTANTESFTYLSELAIGVNTLTLPNIEDRYFQFAIVFDTGTWGTGTVSSISFSYTSSYEYFDAGQFLVDRPSWSSSFGNYKVSVSARDKFKRALETKVTCPSYTSAIDVAKIIRDVADRCGLIHNNGVELIADTGSTVTISNDDNFKDTKALDIFNEVMVYINWLNNNYRLELTTDGYLQLVIKDGSIDNAEWVIDYRSNLLNVSKSEISDNLLQRITVLQKSHSVNPEIELVTQNYITTQSSVDLTWTNKALYKRVDVVVNSGNGVFSLEATENQKITFSITGTIIDIDVTVYGAELQSTPPYIGESIYYPNSKYNDGITFEIINRLAQTDDECRDIAKSLTDKYGNPNYEVNCSIPFNPLIELGDRVLIFEKYTFTKTIYRIDNISLSYSANGASCYMDLSLTDLGSELDNFVWDRNYFINGGISQDNYFYYDKCGIWDFDLGLINEDTQDYENLKHVTFS